MMCMAVAACVLVDRTDVLGTRQGEIEGGWVSMSGEWGSMSDEWSSMTKIGLAELACSTGVLNLKNGMCKA